MLTPVSCDQKYPSGALAVHGANGGHHTTNSAPSISASAFIPAYSVAVVLPAVATRKAKPLTARQLEVGRLVVAGMTNKAIGRKLGITEPTVKIHIREIFRATDLRRRYELPAVIPAASQGNDASQGRLTRRQREVLAMVANGLSGVEIARRLGVNEGAVKAHMTLIMRKIGASNRTAAVAWWVQHGGRLQVSMQAAKAEA